MGLAINAALKDSAVFSYGIQARGGAKNLEFIYKKTVCILTCLNFSHLHTLHLMQYTYQDFFLPLSFQTLQFSASV